MGNMFTNKEDALVWLVAKGWRQNDNGVWLKGMKRADINPSPLNDGVVCVVESSTRVALDRLYRNDEMQRKFAAEGASEFVPWAKNYLD
jgi:hypothetical protein